VAAKYRAQAALGAPRSAAEAMSSTSAGAAADASAARKEEDPPLSPPLSRAARANGHAAGSPGFADLASRSHVCGG